MSIGKIVDTIQNVLAAARNVTAAIPGLQGVSVAIGTAEALSEVGEKLVGVIDGLTSHAPDTRTQQEMQQTRADLAAAVSAKAERTADRFDGP
jgi:hypothetical protein